MSEIIAQFEKGSNIALNVMVPYIARELASVFGEANWWEQGVYSRLYDNQKYGIPESGSTEELSKYIDLALALKIIDWNWEIFKRKHSPEFRSWVKETIAFRNKKSHAGIEGIKDSEYIRNLDNLSLICNQIDGNAESEINEILRLARYGTTSGSGHKDLNPEVKPDVTNGLSDATGLTPWRSIMAPHPDVSEGRYRNAEFAADLSQVARGKASFEYRDPVEFFSRTYVTVGLKALLVQALKRITGTGGEPVIELKTAFGGGKTHSMLALYHMLGGNISQDKVSQLNDALAEAGLSSIPTANIAVVVGTSLSASTSKRPSDMPGITVNTIWGEIAYQLAKSARKPHLYDIIKESDHKGINPGSEALAKLFTEAGPCLILLDELVAYGRALYGVTGLPAGEYGNFLTFIQSLTEAACECSNCLIVASIPESDIEIGGESGQKVLDSISHYFARKEAVWKPVASNEGFEVVRRRLFQRCKDNNERKKTCEAFFEMYRKNPDKYPAECREESYLKRMVDCYPIHPEVFDRLYDDWSTLEKFQKTRGVLRLMACVINKLWESNDANPLIMPGSIPVSMPAVKDELLRYLDDKWDAIVDNEIDGSKSQPQMIERANPQYAQIHSAIRVSRTLFFGSAPSKGQNNRGMTKDSIMLACVQPSEKIFLFEDSLEALSTSLSYLYSNAANDRFWFDTRPTLRKMMEEKAKRITREDAYDEIEKFLKTNERKTSSLYGVHVCPENSLDIPDDMAARMVIVSPKHTYGSDPSTCGTAISYINDILQFRGNSPRMYKNMIIFAVADTRKIKDVEDEARKLIAWNEIKADKHNLDLNDSDEKTVEDGIVMSTKTLRDRIYATYSWLMSPSVNPKESLKDINLNPKQVSVANSLVASYEKELTSNDQLVTQFAPVSLLMELDNYLWKDKDYCPIKDAWKCLCSYCYLPRLRDKTVFDETIRKGAGSNDYFAIADGKNSDGAYINLSLGDAYREIHDTDLLVKPSVAKAFLEKSTVEPASSGFDLTPDPTPKSDICEPKPNPIIPGGGSVHAPATPSGTSCSGFFLSADINSARATKDISNIIDNVLAYVQDIRGSKCKITLEVESEFPTGSLTIDKKRTIEENCKSLHIADFGFEE